MGGSGELHSEALTSDRRTTFNPLPLPVLCDGGVDRPDVLYTKSAEMFGSFFAERTSALRFNRPSENITLEISSWTAGFIDEHAQRRGFLGGGPFYYGA